MKTKHRLAKKGSPLTAMLVLLLLSLWASTALLSSSVWAKYAAEGSAFAPARIATWNPGVSFSAVPANGDWGYSYANAAAHNRSASLTITVTNHGEVLASFTPTVRYTTTITNDVKASDPALTNVVYSCTGGTLVSGSTHSFAVAPNGGTATITAALPQTGSNQTIRCRVFVDADQMD